MNNNSWLNSLKSYSTRDSQDFKIKKIVTSLCACKCLFYFNWFMLSSWNVEMFVQECCQVLISCSKIALNFCNKEFSGVLLREWHPFTIHIFQSMLIFYIKTTLGFWKCWWISYANCLVLHVLQALIDRFIMIKETCQYPKFQSPENAKGDYFLSQANYIGFEYWDAMQILICLFTRFV